MSGLADFGARLALSTILPGGTDRHVALFTVIPDFDGGSGVEVSAGWYSRVAFSDWTTSVDGNGFVSRRNASDISFPAVAGEAVEIVAWGIFDAASGGNLLAFGPTRTGGLVESPFTIAVGDNVRFTQNSLIVKIEPSEDQTIPDTLISEDELQTTDATPTKFDNPIASLENERGFTVEVVVRGRSGTSHYSRRIIKKYTRDDGGPGTTLWNVDELQSDGAATRVGFTTATADLVITGDNVDLEVTGEAATTIEWRYTARVLKD